MTCMCKKASLKMCSMAAEEEEREKAEADKAKKEKQKSKKARRKVLLAFLLLDCLWSHFVANNRTDTAQSKSC